jgi:hypothetical protein
MADRRAKTAGKTKSRAKASRGDGGALRRVVDRNTQAAERIHRAVAGFPLVVLEQIDGLERPVARVRKLQDRSISATYDLVRGIEREVARLVRPSAGAKQRASRKPRTVTPGDADTGRQKSETRARAS